MTLQQEPKQIDKGERKNLESGRKTKDREIHVFKVFNDVTVAFQGQIMAANKIPKHSITVITALSYKHLDISFAQYQHKSAAIYLP